MITSNICMPKCDVHKQNAEIDAWIADNPNKITYIEQGVSTDKNNKKWLQKTIASEVRRKQQVTKANNKYRQNHRLKNK